MNDAKEIKKLKQLFNSVKPRLGGGLNWRTKHLVHKPDQPGTLTKEVQRLVAKRFQNIQEWRKERGEKERIKKNTTVSTGISETKETG